jgi:hypothetical protein
MFPLPGGRNNPPCAYLQYPFLPLSSTATTFLVIAFSTITLLHQLLLLIYGKPLFAMPFYIIQWHALLYKPLYLSTMLFPTIVPSLNATALFIYNTFYYLQLVCLPVSYLYNGLSLNLNNGLPLTFITACPLTLTTACLLTLTMAYPLLL